MFKKLGLVFLLSMTLLSMAHAGRFSEISNEQLIALANRRLNLLESFKVGTSIRKELAALKAIGEEIKTRSIGVEYFTQTQFSQSMDLSTLSQKDFVVLIGFSPLVKEAAELDAHAGDEAMEHLPEDEDEKKAIETIKEVQAIQNASFSGRLKSEMKKRHLVTDSSTPILAEEVNLVKMDEMAERIQLLNLRREMFDPKNHQELLEMQELFGGIGNILSSMSNTNSPLTEEEQKELSLLQETYQLRGGRLRDLGPRSTGQNPDCSIQ